MNAITREWLEYAERDIKAANHLLSLYPVPIEIVCFHCQQCAEKALKAVLVEHDIEPPKTHDLRELCQMCVEFDTAFQNLTAAFKDLTAYGVSPRYPNGLDLDERRMNEALKDSRKVFDFVVSILEEGAEE